MPAPVMTTEVGASEEGWGTDLGLVTYKILRVLQLRRGMLTERPLK